MKNHAISYYKKYKSFNEFKYIEESCLTKEFNSNFLKAEEEETANVYFPHETSKNIRSFSLFLKENESKKIPSNKKIILEKFNNAFNADNKINIKNLIKSNTANDKPNIKIKKSMEKSKLSKTITIYQNHNEIRKSMPLKSKEFQEDKKENIKKGKNIKKISRLQINYIKNYKEDNSNIIIFNDIKHEVKTILPELITDDKQLYDDKEKEIDNKAKKYLVQLIKKKC